MKRRLFLSILCVAVGSMLLSSLAFKEGSLEEGSFPLHRKYALNGKNKTRTMVRFHKWMVGKYGPYNIGGNEQQLMAYGSFYIIARNILGKTTKICEYTYMVEIKDDSLQASIRDVYVVWNQTSTYKGDRGGQRYKALADILPLEKKVPLEKRAYRQYIEQMENHFTHVFAQTERIMGDSTQEGL